MQTNAANEMNPLHRSNLPDAVATRIPLSPHPSASVSASIFVLLVQDVPDPCGAMTVRTFRRHAQARVLRAEVV